VTQGAWHRHHRTRLDTAGTSSLLGNHVRGALAGVPVAAAILILTLWTPYAVARGPVFVMHAPFTGATIRVSGGPVSPHCGGIARILHPASFNSSNGHFVNALGASVHPAPGCGTYNQASAGGVLQLTSPNFTVASSTNSVLRVNWWFHFGANLSSHGSGSGADYQIQVTLQLYDLGPFGGIQSQGIFTNTTRVGGNSSSNLTLNASDSFPISALLTKGHTYDFVMTLSTEVDAWSGYTPTTDSASARLSVGISGHPDVLQGFSLR
jgi:hypothetical protein